MMDDDKEARQPVLVASGRLQNITPKSDLNSLKRRGSKKRGGKGINKNRVVDISKKNN